MIGSELTLGNDGVLALLYVSVVWNVGMTVRQIHAWALEHVGAATQHEEHTAFGDHYRENETQEEERTETLFQDLVTKPWWPSIAHWRGSCDQDANTGTKQTSTENGNWLSPLNSLPSSYISFTPLTFAHSNICSHLSYFLTHHTHSTALLPDPLTLYSHTKKFTSHSILTLKFPTTLTYKRAKTPSFPKVSSDPIITIITLWRCIHRNVGDVLFVICSRHPIVSLIKYNLKPEGAL